jgi:2-amino-4-hydroxy-6-hydroxymethyldihydropteridine diphosphokinase
MSREKKVIFAIGSNASEREKLIDKAKHELENLFQDTVFSRCAETEAIGLGTGAPDFLNCIGTATTTLPSCEVIRQAFKDIERRMGDTRQKREGGCITIDLDLLKLDMEKQQPMDWERPYIKMLMKEMNVK